MNTKQQLDKFTRELGEARVSYDAAICREIGELVRHGDRVPLTRLILQSRALDAPHVWALRCRVAALGHAVQSLRHRVQRNYV